MAPTAARSKIQFGRFPKLKKPRAAAAALHALLRGPAPARRARASCLSSLCRGGRGTGPIVGAAQRVVADFFFFFWRGLTYSVAGSV